MIAAANPAPACWRGPASEGLRASTPHPHSPKRKTCRRLRPQSRSLAATSSPHFAGALQISASSHSRPLIRMAPPQLASSAQAMASFQGAEPAAEEDAGGGALVAAVPSPADTCVLGIMGDLHLEPNQMPLFREARQQMTETLTRLSAATAPSGSSAPPAGPPSASLSGPSSRLLGTAASPSGSAEGNQVGSQDELVEASSSQPGGVCRTWVVQLGDVGGYMNAPGTAACFEDAVAFLDGFGFPRRSVTGNHDLEGWEFATDEENLAAWQRIFGQHHFWEEDLGCAVGLGISTVQFRSAPDSNHEVYVDDEQLEWLQRKLEEHASRPVFVFSHAPPMGSGLTSLQEVHVRNRCAWLNHTREPQRFLSLVRRHANIKLWFSGHFHLSHDYEGSVSHVASCLFVQTGVMGGCHRDGRRHSRVLTADAAGYKLMTLDHGTGSLRTDVVHQYANEARGLAAQRVWCSTLSFLTSCPAGGPFAPPLPADIARRDPAQFPPAAMVWDREAVRWLRYGSTLLAVHANQLLQYDAATRAPIGLVTDGVNRREVRLVLGPPPPGAPPVDGDSAVEVVVAVELLPTAETPGWAASQVKLRGGVEREVYPRNAQGGFWKVFQKNQWERYRDRQMVQVQAALPAGAPASS